MRQFRRIVCLVGLIVLLAISFASAATFETERYNVDVVVAEDNSWQVTENIDMNFLDYGHGIYRYIPFAGSIYYEKDDQQIERRYKLVIDQIAIPGYEYEKSYENNNVVFKIGSADRHVHGPMSYQISYRMSAYDDRDDSMDQFYLDLLPTDWNTAIKAGSVTIQMPKPVAQDQIYFYAGRYGDHDEEAVRWEIKGNTITGELLRPLERGEGLTVQVLLPEGYFAGERSLDWVLPVLLVILMAVPLFAFLLWLLFGRDPKLIKTVEFYPPSETGPAEAGYLIDGTVDNRDLVSMVVDFANRGYLKIGDDSAGSFTLEKVSDLPATAKAYERTLFNKLFVMKDLVGEADLKGVFYPAMTKARSQLVGQYQSGSARPFTRRSIMARFIGTILMAIPLTAAIFMCTHNAQLPMVYGLIALPALLGAMICFLVLVRIYDRQHSLSSSKKAGGRLVAGIVLAACMAAILAYCFYFTGQLVLPVIAVASSVLTMGFNKAMKQRTKDSIALLRKILGFKEFIRTAELDRIQKLVDDDPQYFYKVLPYAYIFGLSDKWIKKFESLTLPPPEWYTGRAAYGDMNLFNTIMFMNMFNNCTRDLQQSMSLPPTQSGSGGFGGGSFGGGGGFSGGGFGGGGGGGW
jgi:uncharacterized membrane protein